MLLVVVDHERQQAGDVQDAVALVDARACPAGIVESVEHLDGLGATSRQNRVQVHKFGIGTPLPTIRLR